MITLLRGCGMLHFVDEHRRTQNDPGKCCSVLNPSLLTIIIMVYCFSHRPESALAKFQLQQ